MSNQRFGWPQLYALLLLSGFVLQALWVSHRLPLRRSEAAYAQAGVDQLRGNIQPRDAGAMPAPAAIAAGPVMPVLFRHANRLLTPDRLKWLLRLPFVAVGWLLGASIWYVARRLYGNYGGYIALALYCFSPAVFFFTPGPLLTGSLGLFGTIFVAIAAAHTLYAPPQSGFYELRSRWRRILLLGLAITLAVGSGFWAMLLILLGLAFMLYLVPDRRLASWAIVLAACAVGAILLLACYGFHPHAFRLALGQARPWLIQHRGITSEVLRAYVTGIREAQNPVLLLIAALAFIAYFAWGRCRYFGNTAPLLALVALTVLSLLTFADVFVGPFPFRATPFLYVFIGGISADLLESSWRKPAGVLIVALLLIYVVTSLAAVMRFRMSVLY